MNIISRAIDTFNTKEGEVTSLLAIPLLLIVLYEVFMRYAFNSPTIWGFEATTFLYGIHYMFGLAYTDVQDGHVRVDILTARLPLKVQHIISIITICILFLPVMTCMTIWSFKYAWTSFTFGEVNSTSWAPPIWPLKIIMAVTFLFLLLQGISNLLKNIQALVGKSGS
jgi:TRAP-type mannitol/chloroaromatic compound transport system permease small subunit